MKNKSLLKKKNFDLTEINKFNSIAYQWWDQSSKFQLLHRINLLRLSYILEKSDGLFGKKVLDIGCGGGILSEGMAKEGALVTGIDMATELLEIAKIHALKNRIKIKYLQETPEDHAKKKLKHTTSLPAWKH